MKQKLLIFCVATILLSGCQPESDVVANDTSTPKTVVNNKAQEQEILTNYTPAQVNDNIQQLAMNLTNDQDEDLGAQLTRATRSSLAIEDNEILINDILYQTNKRALEDANATGLRSVFSQEDIYDLVSKIPYASIYLYVPEGFEGEPEPQYVAAAYYPEDGIEVEEVVAFDFDGNMVQLSNVEEPTVPVLVVGISESRSMRDADTSGLTELGLGLRSTDVTGKEHGTVNHNEYLTQVYMSDDKEPWTKGSPEVYALWAVGKNMLKVHQDYAGFNKEGTWYTLNAYIYSYANWPETMYYKVEFWENDYNWSADAKVVDGAYTYQGQGFDINATFNFSATFGDSDDFMGSTQMYFYHPNGGTFSTGNVKMKLTY